MALATIAPATAERDPGNFGATRWKRSIQTTTADEIPNVRR
jgi:hypothetical protein